MHRSIWITAMFAIAAGAFAADDKEGWAPVRDSGLCRW